MRLVPWTLVALIPWLPGGIRAADARPAIKVLFLGDNGHHRPARRFRQIEPVLARRGIEVTYSDDVGVLTSQDLAAYDGLIVYANVTRISSEQEKALLEYVEGGKGFIPIHCASYCFHNSPSYIALVGAQFQRHGTGVFRTTIAAPEHPVVAGFGGFESWDETYVHTKHNEEGRTVLEYRVEGEDKEPWTWVRTQGKGRVFYTAWGHDGRTWGHSGFHNLIERGILWATGHDPAAAGELAGEPADEPFPVPEMTPLRTDLRPFEYVDVGKKIPNYTRSQRWGTQGEPFSEMQVPLAAEDSLQHMMVPRGFRVELFASDPDLGGKPISMNWDERGRLWVAETVDYPNDLQPPGGGNDRIRICEDTDGDWRADRFTVFAEKLSIPTSLTFSRGGVIVFDGTRTLFLKDDDGDDVADRRDVLFEGWSQRDTHGGPSNMQYGLDNWIWAMQGYNPSRLAVGGETHAFRQGFLRFKPDGSRLEFIRSTDNNTWGFGMSEEGIIFGSTANRNPSVHMPIPNRYYESVRGWAPSLVLRTIADTYLFKPITDKVRQVDQHGGYTAGAGHALYTARSYPKEYWNRTAFVCGPTGHLVGTFVLVRDGSGVRSSNPFNLVASDDEWTAPIMAEVGPDGNVWFIDWYNYIVQHNPTPIGFRTGKGAAYETDLRDKKHGRVYRIVYEKNENSERVSLAGAGPEKLVKMLAHENLLWRRHAQRLLVERGKKDVLAALLSLASDLEVDEIGLNTGTIHALWTMHGLGALDGSYRRAIAAVHGALKHRSAGVRRNAVQVLPQAKESVEALLEAGATGDPDPQVRLMALLALADLPPAEAAAKAVLEVLEDPRNAGDRWIADAATSAAAKNSAQFLEALASIREPSESLLAVARIVAEHHARGAPSGTIANLLERLESAEARVSVTVVDGLINGWPRDERPVVDARLEASLEKLIERLPAVGRAPLIKLASTWGSSKFEKYAAEAVRSLMARAEDGALSSDERVAAARELVAYRPEDEEVLEALLDLVTPRAAPELASGILRALEQSSSPRTGELITERLPAFTPGVRSTALAVLLNRAHWTEALLEQAAEGGFRLTELALDQRQALTTHRDRGIRRRARELLEKGGALPDPDRQKVIEKLLPLVQGAGDAVAGKEVFKKVCANCHVHGQEGKRIGPDLTGMAVHPKEELLIQILDPNRSVEGNFRVYTVVTSSGLVLNGLLASESRTAIELYDAEGQKRSVLREDILTLDASPKSLMPEGFEGQLEAVALRDLLEFLTQRGKYVPLPLDKVATAVSTRGMFYDSDSPVERLIFDDWQPKTFEGVPFHFVDPQGDRVPNAVLLYGPEGRQPPRMPRSVRLKCGAPAKAIHLLSGVSGWGHPYNSERTVTMIVRLHYAGGETEDHELRNGEHFADYIRRVDVPGSKFAFNLRGRQVRYLAVAPRRSDVIETIEFVKGPDGTAPIVMAVTLEMGE